MDIPDIHITDKNHISLNRFREMDYLSVDKYHLPIELMMENAGLNLARLAAGFLPDSGKILISAGTGNNGGGGLVAARRLSGWGFRVFLDIPDPKLKELPAYQLDRALAFGAKIEKVDNPDLFIDALLGFSQFLPLSNEYQNAVDDANRFSCTKISLDLPTGFNAQTSTCLFRPDLIMTLAAMKTELLPLTKDIDIFLADIGLPEEVYNKFGLEQPGEFKRSSLLRLLAPK